PVGARVHEVADLARRSRRMDDAVATEEELRGIVRARQELGDRAFRDARVRRDLVEVLHQQRLREYRKVARRTGFEVDAALGDDAAIVRRAWLDVAHEAPELH